MRLTGILEMPQNMLRLRNSAWQRWRKRRIFDDGLARKLQKSGIQIVDANELVKEDSPLYTNYESLPDVKPVFPQPLKMNSSHPLWKDIPAKVLKTDSFPMEGLKQAKLFTKSVQVEAGLPEIILEHSRSSRIEQKHGLVQNVIQQAYLWDAHLDILPRLRSLEIPVFRYKNSYGIKAETSTEILIRNFLRLCEASFPAEACRTVVGGRTDLRANVKREGYQVQFQLSPLATILSKHLLRPYSEAKGIEDMPLPDISPFNSVVNFEDENIYDETDYISYRPDSGFPFVHTAFFAHTIPGSFTHVHPRWNSDRFTGCTLLYGFATALLMARRQYGENVTTLPEPITTQIVHFTGKEWQFGVFQLNTLDLDEAKGRTKNIAWLTDRIALFDKCAYDYVQGRAVFEGYNPEVFKLLFAMYSASTLEPFPEPPPSPHPPMSQSSESTSVESIKSI